MTEHLAETVPAEFVEGVRETLLAGKRVRRALPGWGRVHVDRRLPFLVVYRRPLVGPDAGTDRLVTSEAAYLTAPGLRKLQPGVARLVHAIGTTMADEFGAFLVLEVWAESDRKATTSIHRGPHFRIVAQDDRARALVGVFDHALSRVTIAGEAAGVELSMVKRMRPPHLPGLLPASWSDPRFTLLGLEVRPVYRDPVSGDPYPLVLRELRRSFTRALRRTFFEFARTQTTNRPEHFHVLGRRAVVKAVWDVDAQLAAVADEFDFLLQVTPMNPEQAWRQFRKDRLEREPVFRYRPVPVDPIVLKRRLYQTPIERVEDPALFHLLRQKQDELDRQLTMLMDLGTPRFLQGSLQVFGGVDPHLARLAEQIMEQCPPRTREDTRQGFLDAATFARRAEAEVRHYHRAWDAVRTKVELRSDIGLALMVSRGTLLVGEGMRIPRARADALIQHEVGTHVVTFYNGCAQPFQQLRAGLAGYDALQEGLAVLSEHLVGGLSRPRLRLLAARVLAVRDLLAGAEFVECFRRLFHVYGFEQRTAFTVTRRIYRGGGLTKDASYLRGLRDLLRYIGRGGALEPLFVGKIAAEHVPIIRELQWREVLREPPLSPRYMTRPEAIPRLEALRAGRSVLDLIERKT